MVYRDRELVCAFCDDPAEARCPRCECKVCALDRHPGRWCLVCQRELDELELEAALREDIERRAPLAAEADRLDDGELIASRGRPTPLGVLFVPYFLRWVTSPFRRRAVRRAFLARNTADIEAWRKAAGIVVR